MQTLGTIKRGDSFSFTAELKDSVTSAALTGIADKLKCQGRRYTYDTLITELTITETETLGTYLFSAASTADWVVGWKIAFDIEYTSDGKVSSSETFLADVEADITHG